jgi:cytochrome b6-f complex iron-sulfur subunit
VIVIAIIAIVVAAVALVAGATRRREMGSATGQLSRETLRADAKRRGAEDEGTAAPGLTGRALEQATLSSRSTAVVPASSTAPTMWVPPDPETIGVTRRQFINRSIVAVMGLAITTFAAASFIPFLWPSGVGGFGSKIRMGKLTDLQAEIKKNSGFLYKPEGRTWLVIYPETALPKAQVAYAGQTCLPGMEAGIVALYQKCPHLGCRVPECKTSQWFECPCHGSQYNQVGEKKGGPAPRGMDRFGVEITADGAVVVNTGDINQGPPIGTNTTGQEAQGPNCISGGE